MAPRAPEETHAPTPWPGPWPDPFTTTATTGDDILDLEADDAADALVQRLPDLIATDPAEARRVLARALMNAYRAGTGAPFDDPETTPQPRRCEFCGEYPDDHYAFGKCPTPVGGSIHTYSPR